MAGSKEDILKIPMLRPDLLFKGLESDKELYRKLAHQWHPDRQGGDLKVFQHIAALYREREQQMTSGLWQGAGVEEYATEGTKGVFSIHYLRQRPFELGTCYICRNSVVYVIKAEHKLLCTNALSSIKALTFADVRMKNEVARYLPSVTREVKLYANTALILEKEPDLIALRDVVAHLEHIPPVHVAWIISRLMGLACYLQHTGIAHGAIDQDALFISPERHVVALLGGWWYAKKMGEKLTYLPAHSARVWRTLHRAVQVAKRANSSLDHALIKTTIRELLGDPGGSLILRNPDIPRPLGLFVNAPSLHKAVDEFRAWEKVREKSFGERRFTKWQLRAGDIYGL